MRKIKAIVFLFLIIFCSVSIASAQLQITHINRGEISREYYEDTDQILSSAWQNSLEMGEYSEGVELSVEDGVLTSSQNTLATNENFSQAALGGHLEVSIFQPAIDYPNGMDSSAEIQIVYYSPFICDYSLSGVASGPGQVILEIMDWVTGEVISTDSWSGAEFSASSQLPPGSYFFHFELLDYVYGSGSVNRNSACDYELFMVPQIPVATDEISFGAVKAMFR